MALTRTKKEEIVADIVKLFDESKLTVLAKYTGTTVKSMQALKKQAKDSHTAIKVVKNRLVIKAMGQSEKFAQADTSALTGQILYAFNAEDEVAPAQVLANFAKSEPQLEFIGAFNSDGAFMDAQDVKALAALPSKDQLRAQLVGLFSSPMRGFVGVLNSNLTSVLNVLDARAKAIN